MFKNYKSIDGNYSLIKNKVVDKKLKSLYDLAKDYDDYGFMSQKVGDILNSLFDDPNYAVGIHRTGHVFSQEEYLKDVFYNGLINNGHTSVGAKCEDVNIERTVSLYSNFVLMSGQIKAAHKYKDSNGVLIIKIPKSYLGISKGEIKPIYYKEENGVFRLLPEFIYGYVPVKEGKVGEIILNPNYSDHHDYDNAGLYYENNLDQEVSLVSRR